MKRIVLILGAATVIALIYYLFIRPFEFGVKLQARTLPGDVIETIRIWNRSLETSKIVEVDSFSTLKQQIVWNQREYTYDWHFTKLNDSLTRINIRISEPGRSLVNKLLIPFTEQQIEKDAAEIAHNFNDVMKEHLEITKVRLIGVTELDSSFCLCSTLSTSQNEKAYGMMKDFMPLTAFITGLKLHSNGHPMVRVQNWSHSEGTLRFDFCFPVVRDKNLPEPAMFTYKQFEGRKVLKAEYYGNYITSDRAWYELIEFARKNRYEIDGFPIESFHNNPNLGIQESLWKAEIYLPVK